MEDQGFPKLQASLTVGNDMLVVRSNSQDEFLANLKFIAEVRQSMREKVETPKTNGDIPTCGIHGTPMEWKTGVSKKTGKPYAFWSCSQRNADGSYCKYSPSK